MGLNLIPSQPLKAAPGMDRKIILAMEKIKQELRQEEHPADPVQGDIKNEFSSVARDGAIPSSLAGEVSPKEDEHAKPVPLEKSGAPHHSPPGGGRACRYLIERTTGETGSLKFVNEDIRVVLRSLAKAYNFEQ